MKILLFLLLFIPLGLFSQSDSNLDRKIVGVVKIYLVEGKTYYSEVTYSDTTEFGAPVLVFDLIAKSYVNSFPIYNFKQFVQILNDNYIKYKEIYEETDKRKKGK